MVRRIVGAPTGDDLCIKLGYPEEGAAPAAVAMPGRAIHAHTGSVRYGPATGEDITVILAEEARLLGRLRSALFPRVVRAGVHDDIPYYVMERLDGETLRGAFARARAAGAPRHVGALGAHFAAILTGLLAIRRRDPAFYHGDLKPENIVATSRGFRLIDPALRRAAAPRPGTSLEATLTAPYNPLGLTDETADTGAIAIMLFEFLSGEHPFGDLHTPLLDGFGAFVRGEDEQRRRAASLLRIERFARHRQDARLDQLLDWIAAPPAYAAMAQALRAW